MTTVDFSLVFIDFTSINSLLSLLNILVLLVCLYIIKDASSYIRKSTEEKSAGAILYLKSGSVLKGFKIIMVGVILWSISKVFSFVETYISLVEGYSCFTSKLYGFIFELLGLFIAILISYGLYVVVASFKPHTAKKKNKKNRNKNKKE